MYDVFFSYSRKDTSTVIIFRDELVKAGFSVWMDLDGVESGDEFKEKIANAINDCSVFLFFSSRNSNVSDWVIKEVGVASYLQKRIIPIRLDQSKYSMKLLVDLINLDFLDCSESSRLSFCLRELIRDLERVVPRNDSDEYLFCPKCRSSQLKVKLQNIQWEKNHQQIFASGDSERKKNVGETIAAGGVAAVASIASPLLALGLIASTRIKKYAKDHLTVLWGRNEENSENQKAPSMVFSCDKCGAVFDLFDVGLKKGA